MSEVGLAGEGPAAEFVRYWLAQRPDLDARALALAMTIARISLLDMLLVSNIAGRCGVTSTDYSLMATIQRGRREGPMRPSDLSRMFNLTPSVVTYRINQLVERGLVSRSADAGDRRVSLLRLTRGGARIVDSVVSRVAAHAAERLTALDGIDGGRESLQLLLSALVERWEQLDQATDEANFG